jgi:hypothetical protein
VCANFSTTQSDSTYEWHTPTTGSGNQNRYCHLVQGNTGWGVIVLQEALRACFNQNISVDGQFGPITKNAVMNAQRQINNTFGANIAVDGEYSPQTASWVVGRQVLPNRRRGLRGLRGLRRTPRQCLTGNGTVRPSP